MNGLYRKHALYFCKEPDFGQLFYNTGFVHQRHEESIHNLRSCILLFKKKPKTYPKIEVIITELPNKYDFGFTINRNEINAMRNKKIKKEFPKSFIFTLS